MNNFISEKIQELKDQMEGEKKNLIEKIAQIKIEMDEKTEEDKVVKALKGRAKGTAKNKERAIRVPLELENLSVKYEIENHKLNNVISKYRTAIHEIERAKKNIENAQNKIDELQPQLDKLKMDRIILPSSMSGITSQIELQKSLEEKNKEILLIENKIKVENAVITFAVGKSNWIFEKFGIDSIKPVEEIKLNEQAAETVSHEEQPVLNEIKQVKVAESKIEEIKPAQYELGRNRVRGLNIATIQTENDNKQKDEIEKVISSDIETHEQNNYASPVTVTMNDDATENVSPVAVTMNDDATENVSPVTVIMNDEVTENVSPVTVTMNDEVTDIEKMNVQKQQENAIESNSQIPNISYPQQVATQSNQIQNMVNQTGLVEQAKMMYKKIPLAIVVEKGKVIINSIESAYDGNVNTIKMNENLSSLNGNILFSMGEQQEIFGLLQKKGIDMDIINAIINFHKTNFAQYGNIQNLKINTVNSILDYTRLVNSSNSKDIVENPIRVEYDAKHKNNMTPQQFEKVKEMAYASRNYAYIDVGFFTKLEWKKKDKAEKKLAQNGLKLPEGTENVETKLSNKVSVA